MSRVPDYKLDAEYAEFAQAWGKLPPAEQAARFKQFAADFRIRPEDDDVALYAYMDWINARSLAEKYAVLRDYCIGRDNYHGAAFWESLIVEQESIGGVVAIAQPAVALDEVAPGQSLIRLAQLMLGDYYTSYVEPSMADMHDAYYEAKSKDGHWRARAVLAQYCVLVIPGLIYGALRRRRKSS